MKHLIRTVCALPLLVLLPWAANAQPPAAGGEYLLEVPARDEPGKKVALVLRFCPAGELRPGDPRRGAEVVPVAAFHVGESEISFAQYEAVLGKGAVRALAARAASLKQDLLAGQLREIAANPASHDQPVFGVGVGDAVSFCRAVNRAVEAGRAGGGSFAALEVRFVRLPTAWEWQYACRAKRTAADAEAAPHFPQGLNARLPRFDDLDREDPARPNQNRCVELARARGDTRDRDAIRAEWSSASPARFQELLLGLDQADNAEQRKKLASVLNEYFRLAYNWPAATENRMPAYSIRDRARRPNEWGLHGMLDNVAEWTLGQGEGVNPEETWAALTAAKPELGKEAETLPRFFLAGGGRGYSFADRGNLARRTIWGGPRGDREMMSQRQDRAGETMAFRGGIRLVLVSRLAPDWLLARKAWVKDDGSFTPDAKAQLARARAVLERLPDAKEALAVIRSYEIRLANRGDASAALEKAKIVQASEKRYLEQLKQIEDD